MKIKTSIATAVCLALTPPVFAHKNKKCSLCNEADDIYIRLEAGASFSNEADMQVATGDPATLWDATAQGYNSDLGTSEVLGAGIGYILTPLLAVEIEVANRDSFEYKKFQSAATSLGDKTRYFDLENTTVMANLFLNGSGLQGPFFYENKYFMIDPYVMGGIGLAYNTVDNFHTILQETGQPVSIMESNTRHSFAYQLGAGFNIRTHRNLGIGIGYRFLDAGSFSSNTYIESEVSPTGTPVAGVSIPAWKGQLKTNEVYLMVNYYL